MKIFIENCSWVLWLCLNLLRWAGFLVPEQFYGFKNVLSKIYFWFWAVIIIGFIVTEIGALVQGWGDVSEMTEIAYLLFTNLSLTCKFLNVHLKRKAVQDIIDLGDYELGCEAREEGKHIILKMNIETSLLLTLYILITSITCLGWMASAEKGSLPFRAWFPYDTSTSPNYQLTLLFQRIRALVVTTLTAVCRCRLQLLNLSLRTLCEDIEVTNKLLTPEEEQIVKSRLHRCVLRHQAALTSAAQIQKCFTTPILAQFTVSSAIICVTAYQLAEETTANITWFVSTTTYFLGMIMQVYFYCNEAHKLSEESSLVADSIYESEWYVGSKSLRRSVLVVMLRSRRVTVITAGGFATLSLSCFVSILRASYSFFTVLSQMET